MSNSDFEESESEISGPQIDKSSSDWANESQNLENLENLKSFMVSSKAYSELKHQLSEYLKRANTESDDFVNDMLVQDNSTGVDTPMMKMVTSNSEGISNYLARTTKKTFYTLGLVVAISVVVISIVVLPVTGGVAHIFSSAIFLTRKYGIDTGTCVHSWTVWVIIISAALLISVLYYGILGALAKDKISSKETQYQPDKCSTNRRFFSIRYLTWFVKKVKRYKFYTKGNHNTVVNIYTGKLPSNRNVERSSSPIYY